MALVLWEDQRMTDGIEAHGIYEVYRCVRKENERLRKALECIAGFGQVNLSAEWEHGLRDIIRSMTDCAREALVSPAEMA